MRTREELLTELSYLSIYKIRQILKKPNADLEVAGLLLECYHSLKE